MAREELKLDRLLVIPANVSPFKLEGDSYQPPWDRLEMVRNAFRDEPATVVDEREIRRGGVSYAIDTVREIAAENPDSELYFILGEDSVEGLPRWKDYAELKRICVFKPFPRTAENSTEIRRLFSAGAVKLNPESQVVATVKAGLKRKGGFCPCRLPKNPEFFCPCREFLSQLESPAYHGPCHCRLYVKE